MLDFLIKKYPEISRWCKLSMWAPLPFFKHLCIPKKKIPIQRFLAVREAFVIIVSLYIAQRGKENARFPDKKVSPDFTMVQINYVGTTSFFQAPMYSYKKNTIPTVASCSGSLRD